jgi:hypothetical protein
MGGGCKEDHGPWLSLGKSIWKITKERKSRYCGLSDRAHDSKFKTWVPQRKKKRQEKKKREKMCKTY